MYSDNLGASFSISNKEEGGNECQAAALSNGSLILNQRTRGPQRQLSYSYNNGATWTEPRPVVLAGTGASTCCGSTVSVGDGHLLVFSGPNSDSRKNMSIYTSTDSGASWECLHQLGDPTLAGGYSSLAAINVRLNLVATITFYSAT
jgi:sialidase-1